MFYYAYPDPDAKVVVDSVEEPVIPRMGFVVNMVLTSSLGQAISMPRLLTRYPHIDYNPEKFAAANIHYMDPRITCLLFPSGKVVIAGAKNIYAALYVILKCAAMIRKEFPLVKVHDFKVRNIICTYNLDRVMDLQGCLAERPLQCVLPKKHFPGMPVTPGQGTIKHIVFTTGNILVTGARSPEQAMESLGEMIQVYDRNSYAKDSPEAAELLTRTKRQRQEASAETVDQEDLEIENILNDLIQT